MRARLVGHGRINPVLWTVTSVAAVVDEGDDAVAHLNYDRQGNDPTELHIYLRPMTASELGVTPAEVAGSQDLNQTFQQSVIDSAAAATGVTTETQENGDIKVILAVGASNPFVITFPTVDNPAQQGDKFFGVYGYEPSQGVVTDPSAGFTINDTTGSVTVPTNITVPSFSDNTPHSGETEVVSGGTWNGQPTHRRFRIYRRSTGQGSSGFAVGAGGELTSAGTTSFSVLNVPIERPSSGRHVLVCIRGRTSGANNAVVNAAPFPGAVLVQTAGAVTARQQNGRESVEWWIGAYPEGNTINLTLSFSETMLRGMYAVFDLQDLSSVVAHDVVKTITPVGQTIGGALDIPAGGYGFVGVGSNSSGVWTFSGATLRKTHGWFGVASDDFATLQTDRSIVATYSIAMVVPTFCAVSFASAATGEASPIADSGFVPDTSFAYVLKDTDVGFEIEGREIARNAAGDSAEAVTGWLGPVQATPGVATPSNVTAPASSSGNPQVGVPLSHTLGVWTNDPTFFNVKVQQNISGTWTDIQEWLNVTAAQTYTPVAGNQGRTLRWGVAAGNTGGTAAYTFSAATAAVAAAPSGTLTNVTLSFDAVAPNAAANTLVGNWVGNGAISSVAFAPGGDAGGVFALNGLTGLKVGSVSPTFFNNASPKPAGMRHYTVSVIFNGNLQRNFDILPYFQKIQPTGGAGGSITDVTTMAAFRSALQADSTTPRIVRIPTSTTGVFHAGNSTAALIQSPCENLTVMGHRQVYAVHDGPIEFRGLPDDYTSESKNIRLFNLLCAVGGDLDGYSSYDNRDNIIIRNGDTIIVENITSFYSVDETVSIIGGAYRTPRNIRFHRCFFARGMHPGSRVYPQWHTEGAHAVGALMGDNAEQNLVFDKCVFSCFDRRHPLAALRSHGVLVQNCISNWFGNLLGNQANWGMGVYKRSATAGIVAGTVVFRGNILYHPNMATGTDLEKSYIRRGHIVLNTNNPYGPDDKLYVPEGTNHDNWARSGFGRPASSQVSYRITRQDVKDGGDATEAEKLIVVSEMPFRTEMDDELMPTSTLAEQQALWDDVWLKVGCRALDGSNNIIAGEDKVSQIQYNEQQRMISMEGRKGTYPSPENGLEVYPTTVPG